jgi:hypothetical protein
MLKVAKGESFSKKYLTIYKKLLLATCFGFCRSHQAIQNMHDRIKLIKMMMFQAAG